MVDRPSPSTACATGQRIAVLLLIAVLLELALCGLGMRVAEAQQTSQPQQPQQTPQLQPQPQPQQQQSAQWAAMPHMQLERQFAGPLQDTIVQRWRDPADGTVCYIYLPITAQHSPPTTSGFVQYGPNAIGSISCMPAQPAQHATAAPRHPPSQ